MLIMDLEKKIPQRELIFHNNPLVEMTASIHVLSDPEHHENCESWVMKANSSIGKALRNEIIYFATNYNQWLFIMDIVTGLACVHAREEHSSEMKMEEGLEKLKDLEELEFAYLFLGLGALHISRETLREWMEAPDQISEKSLMPIRPFISRNNVIVFLQNIETYKHRVVDILENYWKKVFSLHWGTIQTYIGRVIGQQEILAGKMDPLEYILSIHSGMDIVNEKLVLRKEVNYEMDLEEISQIHIFPSVFTAPHFMMDIKDTDLILYYNLDFYSISMADGVPEEIMAAVKVLSDENRVKILKIVWREGATTQRLSAILSLAPSTVSVHLKLLKKANLVSSRQIKKFVYYEANRDVVENVWPKLSQYFNC